MRRARSIGKPRYSVGVLTSYPDTGSIERHRSWDRWTTKGKGRNKRTVIALELLDGSISRVGHPDADAVKNDAFGQRANTVHVENRAVAGSHLLHGMQARVRDPNIDAVKGQTFRRTASIESAGDRVEDGRYPLDDAGTCLYPHIDAIKGHPLRNDGSQANLVLHCTVSGLQHNDAPDLTYPDVHAVKRDKLRTA